LANELCPVPLVKNDSRQASWSSRPGMHSPSASSDTRSGPSARTPAITQPTANASPTRSAVPVAAAVARRQAGGSVWLKRTLSGSVDSPRWTLSAIR
jgi:hypothetical protein